eukprot:365913-Chlamydomonas_euryale.AAC.9
MKSRTSENLSTKKAARRTQDHTARVMHDEELKETEAEDHAGVRRSPRLKHLRPAVHHGPRSAEALAGRREDNDGARVGSSMDLTGRLETIETERVSGLFQSLQSVF